MYIPQCSANNPSSQCFYYPNPTPPAVCWRKAKRSVERAGPCNCRPWLWTVGGSGLIEWNNCFFGWLTTEYTVYSTHVYSWLHTGQSQISISTENQARFESLIVSLTVTKIPTFLNKHYPQCRRPFQKKMCATKWHLSTNSSTPPAAKVVGREKMYVTWITTLSVQNHTKSQYDKATTCNNLIQTMFCGVYIFH